MVVPDTVALILDEAERLGGPPKKDESRLLAARFADGNKRAWDDFAVRNSPMVAKCVMHWCQNHQSVKDDYFEDLFQAGMKGLLHSMKRIDLTSNPDMNPTTYCFMFIVAEIRRTAAREITKGMAKESALRAAWESGDAELSREIAGNMQSLSIMDHDHSPTGGQISDEDEQYPTYVFDLMDRMDRAMEVIDPEAVRVLAMRYGLWGGVPQSYAQIGKVLECGAQMAKEHVEASVSKLRAAVTTG